MAINKVQFQKGMSMPEFLEKYGTEQQCQAALVAMRWPHGFVCPNCGEKAHSLFSRSGRQHWQCSACRHQTTVTAGTVFEATKLPLTRWFLAMHLLTQAKNTMSALELKRHLGVRYVTAWMMKHKLMQVMAEREDGRILDERVEIDDAYLGGERTGGKPGRGSENKIPFVAAVQTTPDGQAVFVRFDPIPFTKAGVEAWAKKALAASAEVVSDGLACFGGVIASGASHTYHVTSERKGKAAAQHPAFRAVNTLLGNLKTALAGTCHAFKFAKYADRYLSEFQYRFNRRFNLSVIFRRLLRASAVTGPRPMPFLRKAEVHG